MIFKGVFTGVPEPLMEGIISDVDPTFDIAGFTSLVNDVMDLEHEDNKTYRALVMAYGKKVAEALVSWLQQQAGDLNGTENNNLSSGEVFQLLQDLPKDKALDILARTLGGGSSGVAVRMKNGKVIKKLFKDFKHQDNAKFYTYCLKQKPKVFLQVSRIGKDYIVSDWCQSPSTKCREYARAIGDAIDATYAAIDDGEIDVDYEEIWAAGSPMVDYIKDPEIRKWAFEVDKHLLKIGDRKIGWGDIRAVNLGEAPDGQIMLIDP